jgi:hypothetical protein
MDGTSRHFQLKVPPSDIPLLKAYASTTLGPEANDADDWLLLPGGAPPPWWRPRDLPDGDLLTSGDRGFVFSAKTGIVYVVEWQ